MIGIVVKKNLNHVFFFNKWKIPILVKRKKEKRKEKRKERDLVKKKKELKYIKKKKKNRVCDNKL